MIHLRNSQFDFRSGVLTKKLTNRSDLNIYKSGVLVGQNFITQLQGSATARFGFEYVRPTRLNQEAFFYRFVFNDEQSYVIEATPYKFRFYTRTGIITEEAKSISAITNANPCQVTVTSHGYSDGDEVYISGVGGMTELNGNYYLVKVLDADNFTLQDIDGNDINSTSYGTYTSGGTTGRVYEIDTPYSSGDEIEFLQFGGRADVRYITSANHIPRKLIRYGETNWSLETYTRTNDPFEQKSISNITNANPAQVTVTSHGYSDGDQVIIEDVQGMTEVNNQTYTVTVVDANNFTIGVDSTGWGAYTSGGVVSEYGNQPIANGVYASRCFFGGTQNDPDIVWGSRSPDTSTGALRFDDFTLGSNPDDAVMLPLSSLNESADMIRFFVGTRKFLCVGTYGGMSKLNGGSDSDPIAGDSVASYPIDAVGIEDVYPVSFGSDILYVQRGGEIVLSFKYSLVDDGYTSASEMIQSDELARAGVRKLAFQQGKPDLVWAVLNDGTMLSLTYKRSEDTSAWNTHKLGGGGVVITACGQPQADNEDRLWIVAKYEINGVDRYYVMRSVKNVDIPEKDDIYSGNEDDDEEEYLDKLYYAQQRLNYLDCSAVLDTTQDTTITPSAVSGDLVLFTAGDNIFSSSDLGRYIKVKVQNGGERGIAKIVEYVSATQVKCKILEDFTSIDTISSGNWYLTKDTISGLDYLEGRTVNIIGDGNKIEPKVVTNGSVNLGEQVSYAIVGFAYTAILKTMPLDLLLSSGSTVGSLKSIAKIKLVLRNSRLIKTGTDLYGLYTISFRRGGMEGGRPTPLFNGVVEIPAFDKYDFQRSIYVVQADGLPCTIQGIACDINVDMGA